MCRLFGFRSIIPSHVHRSLVAADNALGAQSEAHPDGWGVAYYVDGAPHVTRMPATALDDHLFQQLSGVVSSETLLAHASFVRALARSLVRDEAAAEDIEQETWLQALQSGPRRAEALPAWLRVVARNVAFKRLRGAARRRAREEREARPEAQPSTAERVEREQSLKGVVAAVKADRALALGVNTWDGACTYEAVATGVGVDYVPLETALG